jgi:Tol biopolymer transport system component
LNHTFCKFGLYVRLSADSLSNTFIGFYLVIRKDVTMEKKRIFRQFVLMAILISVGFSFNGCHNPTLELPTLSDGNIAFTRVVTGGTDIFLYGTSSDDGINLTKLGTGWNAQSAISPDKTKIAFVSRRDGNREIYVMNRDGSSVIRLTNNAAWDSHPAWSSDGTKLAFVSNRDGVHNIYIMSSVDGLNVIRVTNNARNDESPSWSPDGKQIVFSSELGSDPGAPMPRLYKINTDGTGQTQISKTVKDIEIEPSWSSLNVIAFTRSSDADGAQIYTMNPDGSQVAKLTSGAGGWHPSWSAGGDKIVFVSDRTGTVRIYTMLSSGANILQLITKSGMEFEPDW